MRFWRTRIRLQSIFILNDRLVDFRLREIFLCFLERSIAFDFRRPAEPIVREYAANEHEERDYSENN